MSEGKKKQTEVVARRKLVNGWTLEMHIRFEPVGVAKRGPLEVGSGRWVVTKEGRTAKVDAQTALALVLDAKGTYS